MLFLWTFYSSKNPVFNIDNNQKCFLGSKSDFWRSCDTEDWSKDAENSALITGINYILQYIKLVFFQETDRLK